MDYFFNHLLHEFQLPLKNPVLIFSLILFIILLSPIILKRLNFPGIIGLIISGVIIGPYGFFILEKNSAIDLFSTIGLLYIMFIAGLELDMNEFKVNKNKSLAFGFLTFIIPISIGYPVCFYLLNYDFNASLLTASMFATHTLVAYPIVSKFGISKNQAVAVTVGGTILTDTVVLIMLAVIMGNNQGSLDNEFWIRLSVSLAIFSIIMFFIIPRIAKWFFRKLESEKHAHYIFVLSVVFFAAFLAEVAGVEWIIGAFVAGLSLNKLIPHSSPLMNRIEFIGNALFIPFFLISVGMLVDVRVILSGPQALVVAGTLTLVAVTGKWIAAYLTQKLFRYTRPQRQLIFGLSSAHAAATLAIILVGYKAGILDENILNGTIILILITCIIASFATEKAAKKIILSDDSVPVDSQSETVSDEHILLPISSDSKIDKLFEFAVLIKDKRSANPISVLSVVPNNEEAESNIVKEKRKLENFVSKASATELKANVITTIDHNIISGISRTSREIMANLVIIDWPEKSTIFEKLLGEKKDNLVNSIEKNIFICNLSNPLISSKRIFIITTSLAEKESGFGFWVEKTCALSNELSLPVIHYGNKKTNDSITSHIKSKKLNSTFQFSPFDDWDDFLILSRSILPSDILILVTARKGSVSYHADMEPIPSKMEKYFVGNNKILIYPQQYNQHYLTEGYEDISHEPFTKGIENLTKEIGNIFKKK